jgi:hypothetical protein
MRTIMPLALFGGAHAVSWTQRFSPRAQARTSNVPNTLTSRDETPKTNYTRPKDPAYDPRFKHFECGTSEFSAASQDLLEVHKALFNDPSGGAPGARLRARTLRARNEPVTINVAIHIVTTKAKENTIAKDVPEKQVAALNQAYKDTGFAFNLLDTTWTADDLWAVGATDDDTLAMKTALRKGTYQTLNLYFQTDLAGSILGVCSMPSDISDPSKPATLNVDPTTYVDDGCSVNAGTMPGGSIYGYSQGMTAAHETGHWLGLFHVFEGYSCDGDGDLIADTAPQSQSTDGCPVAPNVQDSCLGDVWSTAVGDVLPPGVSEGEVKTDNVHNVMDYSTDACYTGFTPLQVQRMRDLWGLYRKGR